MIIVLAGDESLGVEVGRAIASLLPQVAILEEGYFLPVENQPNSVSNINEEAPDAPWLHEALAVSAQQVAAHGGTSVIVLPRVEDSPSLLAAFKSVITPVYLFLLRKPKSPQGVLRRAALISARSVSCVAAAQEVLECAAQGRGLIRPAPAGTADKGLFPTDGGPCTGVDIIEISRIAGVVQRYGDRFLHRVYTASEQMLYRGRVPELAARFAAKEAISKALGTGIWGIRWREMEVLPDMRGKPLVFLHGAAAARAREINLRHFDISLSHSREFAVAVVVAT